MVGLCLGVGEVLLWTGLLFNVWSHQVTRVQTRGRVAGQAMQMSLHLQLLQTEGGGQYCLSQFGLKQNSVFKVNSGIEIDDYHKVCIYLSKVLDSTIVVKTNSSLHQVSHL